MNGKSEKQKSMDSIPGEWKKISPSGILEFQNILRILNRYYDAFSQDKNKSDTQKFREEISYLPGINLECYVKKFGKYEYLVYCEIRENLERVKSDTWIHIDGIAEERDLLKEKDIINHPVNNIYCMKDIYENCTEDVKDREMVV